MMEKHIVGVDPGNNGGIVVLRRQKPFQPTWTLFRCFKLERGEDAIAEFVREVAAEPSVAFLEKVHGWGEGRSFNFGKYYGFVRGVLVANGVRIVDVTPQAWMKEMGVPKQRDIGKAAHRQAMRELAEGLQGEVTATNWNAAAVLIALHGLKTMGGRLV